MLTVTDPITLFSTASGFAALLWCLVLFAALAGWGYLVCRLLRIQNADMALAVCLGLALQCLLGGALNLLHLVFVPVLLVFIALGLVAFVWHRASHTSASLASLRQAPSIALLLVATLIFLHLVSFIHPYRYEVMDDLQAYILFPVKMLQTHHLAADPFSQRRVIGSLGFNYYLQDWLLTLAPIKNLTLVDGVFGVLVLAFSSLGLSRTLALTRSQTLLFLLIAGLTKQIWWNLSFVWLPCGLFLALAYLVSLPALRNRPLLQPLIVGCVGGAAGALKNNHLVFSVLYIVVFYLLLALSSDQGAFNLKLRSLLQNVGLAALGAFATIALWMIDLHRYSGTFFFPVLGHGFEFTTYHLLPVRHMTLGASLLKVALSGVPLLLLGAFNAALLLGRNRKSTWTPASISLVALTLAGGLATTLTAIATGADNIRRYCYPEIIVAVLAVPPSIFFLRNHQPRLRFGRSLQCAALLLVAAAFASDVWNSLEHFLSPAVYWDRHLSLASDLRNERLNTAATLAEYQNLQAALPPNSVVLEQVLFPYLLDNRKQTFYEASLPAMASPPPAPGWPILSDGNALAEWLLSHHVRYLMYSYGDSSGWPDPFLREQMANTAQTAIMHSTLTADYLAHQQYLQLYRTRHHVFDDGHIFVLDLQQPD